MGKKESRRQAKKARNERKKKRLAIELPKKAPPAGVIGEFLPILSRKIENDRRVESILTVIKETSRLWVRDPMEYVKKGKSTRSIIISLIEHTYTRYPVPSFLFADVFASVPYEQVKLKRTIRIIHHLGTGKPAKKILPHTFTKKMCHAFVTTKKGADFYEALRRAQGDCMGIQPRITMELLANPIFTRFDPWTGSTERIQFEERNHEIMLWFSNQHMLDPAQVGPIADFLSFHPQYSLKGRTPSSIDRAIKEWHRELGHDVDGKNALQEYEPSGILGWQRNEKVGEAIIERWRIDEILTRKALREEGAAQKHCVLSYAKSIESGYCSIWSLKEYGQRCITLEVRKGQIVQARGKCNRLPNNEERNEIKLWAQASCLTLASFVWR